MRAVTFVLRTWARTGWRAWLVLGLLIGVVGGPVLTAAAGARRTDTAYSRLERSVNGADVLISPNGTGLTGYYDALRHAPGVIDLAEVALLNTGFQSGSQSSVSLRIGRHTVEDLNLAAGLGDRMALTVGRPVARWPSQDPWHAPCMTEAVIGLVLDCKDPEALAEFWSLALGIRRLGAAGNYVLLASETGALPKLLLQRVDEDKVGKNRMHLDIETPDVDGEVQRLESLGARRLEEEARTEHGSRWVILADPEGNEFCVCDGGQASA